jgi:hypothetical protein
MTAFAFILGVVPLMKSSGAGAGAQNVMGTSVFFGMLVATALGVFIIPGNFTFIEGLKWPWRKAAPVVPVTPEGFEAPVVLTEAKHDQGKQAAVRPTEAQPEQTTPLVTSAGGGSKHL